MALRASVSAPAPVWPRLPAAGAFAPLVFFLAAVVPVFVAWYYGSVNEVQAAWGLRGLDVLESSGFSPSDRANDYPPLLSWSAAAAIALPVQNKLSVLLFPAYVYSVASVALVYLIGRICFSKGIGLLGCFLFGLNQLFLHELHHGGPTSCVLFWMLLSTYLYLKHIGHDEVISVWTLGGGVAFAGVILAGGMVAIWLGLLGLLHIFYREWQSSDDYRQALREIVKAPATHGGLLVVLVGAALASPWLWSSGWHGGVWSPWRGSGEGMDGRLARYVIEAMPATIILAMVGLVRGVRRCVKGTRSVARIEFAVLWILIAGAAFSTTHPVPHMLLYLVIPMTLFAAQTLFAIIDRDYLDREILAIMLAAAAVLVIDRSPPLRSLPTWWWNWAMYTEHERTARELALHYGFDALLLSVGGILVLYRASMHKDRYRRALFGVFVVGCILASGSIHLLDLNRGRRREDPWLLAYERLNSIQGVGRVIFVGANGRHAALEYVVRSIFPHLPRERVADRNALGQSLRDDASPPLVLVTDALHRLPNETSLIGKDNRPLTLQLFFDDRDRVIAYAPARDVKTNEGAVPK